MTTHATLTINGIECAVPMDSPYFKDGYFQLNPHEVLCVYDCARWRSIIAAVARSYWLDCAQKISRQPFSGSPRSVQSAEDRQNWHDEIAQCEIYAAAWARVGALARGEKA